MYKMRIFVLCVHEIQINSQRLPFHRCLATPMYTETLLVTKVNNAADEYSQMHC